MTLSSIIEHAREHHGIDLAVAAVNTSAYLAGAMDWIGDTGEKVIVSFLIAVVSGFGHQLVAHLWRRFGPS